MVKLRVADITAPGERRDHQGRHSKAEACIAPGRSIACRNRFERRRNVIEEASPLIEVDDEHSPRPRGALGNRGVDLVQKRFTIPDVCMRMVVVRSAAGLIIEPRIDEGFLWGCARCAVSYEFSERPAELQKARTPQRCEGN